MDNCIVTAKIESDRLECYYDAFGRRVVREVDNKKSALIWWGNSENAEHEHQAGQIVIQNDIMSHPYLLNSVIARAVDGSKSKLEWCHKNYLDHVYAVSDNDGDILEHYRYTAFGEVSIFDTNGSQVNVSQIDNQILWNTRRLDQVSGFYLYKYRHYSAELGRWLSRDPIGESGGVNLYAFVLNNPVILWDKLGRKFSHKYQEISIQVISEKHGVWFYTGPPNGIVGENRYPVENIGFTDFDTKSEGDQCCVKVKKVSLLNVDLVTKIPNDAQQKFRLNEFPDFGSFEFTQAGFDFSLEHENRRVAAFEEGFNAFLKPAEESGEQVTKCGWVCRDSYDAAEAELDDYISSVQAEAISQYKAFQEHAQRDIIGNDATFHQDIKVTGSGANHHNVFGGLKEDSEGLSDWHKPNPIWTTPCP